ncbi:GlxA family transcriptional regulator [Nocardia alni]|uniref:GlxA family transcriptional regulator n=1 Tax=Nocardia alni TaxID=2815723 RepID=UPI001C2494EC|nr:helix-turn-helix domain-containing protein [Nocardia alni]
MEVAVLVYDGVFDSGLAAMLDVLDGANGLAAEVADPPTWNVVTVGLRPEVRTGAGLMVTAESCSRVESADLLIVPAVAERRPPQLLDFISGIESAPIRDLIAATCARGTSIASACTGTFLLAEARVLDGHRATTSWWLAPIFRNRYPSVDVDQSSMVIASGRITTAAAAFGHVDLALSIVRDTSPALADLVAHYLVVDERPSQSAYTITSALAQHDPTVAAFERWVREHLADPISIPDASRHLGISERTLQRAVGSILGISPIRFVQNLRVERAAHLLRTTDQSLESIARKVGYEHPNTLRVLIRQRTGKTTAALRSTSR